VARSPVGLVFISATPPEQIAPLARMGEELGFGEVWIVEEFFQYGGISAAAAALAATREVPVGIGIISAMVRHPALAAMEIASLARSHPGRLMAGFGLGLPDWLRQMGIHPPSQLAAMRECVTSVRALLRGEEVTLDGRVFKLDRVQLSHLPEPVPDVYMGVIGPKMLKLSGEVADGTIASAFAPPQYVRFARDRIAEGGGGDGHRLPLFAALACDRNARAAKEALRPIMAWYLSIVGVNAMTDAYGCSEELADMLARGGTEVVARELPDAWLDDFAVAGDPEECAEKIRRYLDAGADSIALSPVPPDRADQMLRLAAAEVLPRVA
jgi:alkanesulfonate monooxygenase SsuD/methylene tetrahydromethanopterin reductase-like flavin-dependent oxidoreductase (luciferase family)